MNILFVENIEINTTNDGSGIIIMYKATVNVRVDIKCNIHGNKLMVVRLTANASGMDKEVALQRTVQSLLDHEYHTELSTYDARCGCSPSLNKMAYDFSDLQEPFKSLFEQLFTDSNWDVQKLIEQVA